MSEHSKPSDKLRQPAMTLPEKTGDVVVDKANLWFFSAQWHANKIAREEDMQIAEDLGLPRPEATQMPDFTDDHSKLLTQLGSMLEHEGTQEMLANFEDVRHRYLTYRQIDILPDQMEMLQAVMNNPDLRA